MCGISLAFQMDATHRQLHIKHENWEGGTLLLAQDISVSRQELAREDKWRWKETWELIALAGSHVQRREIGGGEEFWRRYIPSAICYGRK